MPDSTSCYNFYFNSQGKKVLLSCYLTLVIIFPFLCLPPLSFFLVSLPTHTIQSPTPCDMRKKENLEDFGERDNAEGSFSCCSAVLRLQPIFCSWVREEKSLNSYFLVWLCMCLKEKKQPDVLPLNSTLLQHTKMK